MTTDAPCAVCVGTGQDPRFTVPVPCPACGPKRAEGGWSARLLRRGAAMTQEDAARYERKRR
jgi:hypothetical protein